MAWAIFHRECNWSRPRSVFSFNAKASAAPQERPLDFVEYCIGRGWAEHVASPNREDAKALKPKRQRRK